MNNCFLTSLTISGIKNIEKPITIDFYKKAIVPFSSEKYKVKAIYGENGAGKSAIITSISIIRDIIFKPNYLLQEKTQKILNELINKNTETLCVSITFLIDFRPLVNSLQQYRYDTIISKKENLYVISREACYERNPNSTKNQFILKFEQQNGHITYCGTNDANFKSDFSMNTANLLSSQFAASVIFKRKDDYSHKYKNEVFNSLLCVLAFFASLRTFLSEDDMHEINYSKTSIFNKFFGSGNQAENSDWIENLFNISQSGIRRIPKKDLPLYQDNLKRLFRFVKLFKRDLCDIYYNTKEAEDYYECELILDYGGKKKVSLEYESTGIKKIISLYDAFCLAQKGYIVFIDEMDANINEVYLGKLIEFFQLYGEGQLCFTTHNLSTMDILKKDKKSIEYLSSENEIITWTAKGNLSPINDFKRGNIPGLPFNVEASDFLGIIGD